MISRWSSCLLLCITLISCLSEQAKYKERFSAGFLFLDIDVSHSKVTKHTVKKNETFSVLLQNQMVSYDTIVRLISEINNDVFDLSKLRLGHTYFLVKNNAGELTHFIYQISATDFLVCDLWHKNQKAYVFIKQKHQKIRVAYGRIHSSLYECLHNQHAPEALSEEMASIFAWAVDFYKIHKGDSFAVVYSENYVDGQSVGLDNIQAAEFTHKGKVHHAFYYQKDSLKGYFDLEGKSVKKGFLKAPVKYTRISSRFSKRRFHPVQKRYKAHLGTDYAAPYGTPIVAVANGTVIEASRKRYNGNYIKIKHKDPYMTQYLHLQKFAKGIRKGSVVRQGDVIGYVGSTGLATGPHVCYRFWKEGKQINPLALDLSTYSDADSIKDFKEYKAVIKPYKERLKCKH